MVLIQFDLKNETDKKLKKFMIDKNIKDKREAIQLILAEILDFYEN